MAKAQEIEISPWEPYALTGARIVRARAQEMFEASDGVLDTGDIERVHAMRVASRRLRAVLEVFAPCFPRDEYKSVLRDVKRLADALGERRDPDVHIEALESFSALVMAAQRPGVEVLIETQRDRQARGNEILEQALHDAASADLRGRLQRLAQHAEGFTS